MSSEKDILRFLSTTLNGHARSVEGDSYRSVFGGDVLITPERFPLMTTERVHLFDIVEALSYKHIPMAVSSLIECPFNMTVMECATRNFVMQFYIMENVLYAQCFKHLSLTADFSKDLARMALCHRAVAFKLGVGSGPLKIHFGEIRMPMQDQQRLKAQLKKKPRIFPELTFKNKAITKIQLDGRDIMLSGYYPID
tara:strand:- start:209 stop:796 length:588 start_codon:yes stop_codon:yes gene_type:complete